MSDLTKDPALTADILAAVERHGGWRNMLNKLDATQVVDDAMLDRFIRKYYARGMTVDIDRLRAALTAAIGGGK